MSISHEDFAMVSALQVAIRAIEAITANRRLVYVAEDERRLELVTSLCRELAGGAVRILELPASDILPYDQMAASPTITGKRVRTLDALSRPIAEPFLLLTSAEAILQRVPSPAAWLDSAMWLEQGGLLDTEALCASLAERGYSTAETVEEPGEVALRGRTVDIFPAGDERPVRLSIGDDAHIAALSTYDPGTQRTVATIERVAIHRAIEFPLDPDTLKSAADSIANHEHDEDGDVPVCDVRTTLVSVFDYLSDMPVALDGDVFDRIQLLSEQINNAYVATMKAARVRGIDTIIAHPDQLYITPRSVRESIETRIVDLSDASVTFDPPHTVQALIDRAHEAVARGDAVVIAAPCDIARVAASLARRGLAVSQIDSWMAREKAAVNLLQLDTATGLRRDGVLLLPIGLVMRSREPERRPLCRIIPAVGDVVVHREHGVSVLKGLTIVEGEGGPEERIALAFANDTELLIPVDEIGQIWRYGEDTGEIARDRVDGEAWELKRRKVEADIAETAQKLFSAASDRAALKGHRIVQNAECLRLARRFPYPLSADQKHAVDRIMADLNSGRPMDRLLCGDVGFGKTEVALRAIAAVALAGFQVALVAPTSVLARQHLDTLNRRFKGAMIRIESLRSTTSADGKAVIKGLAQGDISIVVGTQAIASDRVTFATPGLIIIDEEQRFGEIDKARLAKLGNMQEPDGVQAHRLVMTATPIPRTLQTAMVGLRDVSIIATPPLRRQPTRTFVMPWDDGVVREALLREQRRRGQSFVVVPRISDLPVIAKKLADIVPSLTVTRLHGKMPSDALEQALAAFGDGESDVLLATNIIESGLDLPRANTIFVFGSERFGLTQLHQMRGRVGRSARRGYAYFMPGSEKRSKGYRKRLETLERLCRLGEGAAISAADLEQRGAGDLFGDRQTGHFRTIGTDLYQHLLLEAVERKRGKMTLALPTLWVGVSGYIPADYVPEPNIRLELYARCLSFRDENEIAAFEAELVDRFGRTPGEVGQMMNVVRLRCYCAIQGVQSLEAGPRAAALIPRDAETVDCLAKATGGDVKSGRVLVAMTAATPEERIERLIGFLK